MDFVDWPSDADLGGFGIVRQVGSCALSFIDFLKVFGV